jgi:flavin-binding protein dodecin
VKGSATVGREFPPCKSEPRPSDVFLNRAQSLPVPSRRVVRTERLRNSVRALGPRWKEAWPLGDPLVQTDKSFGGQPRSVFPVVGAGCRRNRPKMRFWLDRPGTRAESPRRISRAAGAGDPRRSAASLPTSLEIDVGTAAESPSAEVGEVKLDDDLATRNSVPPLAYGLQDLRICSWFPRPEEVRMADVYRVTEVVGVSSESWEAAARVAVETAAQNVRELRVAEVVRRDLTIQDGAVVTFRVRLGISFKYDQSK